jgi:hypothetical protein
LLDWSPDNVYMPYVCEYYKELHVRHYVVASVLLHWHCGIVALWHQGAVALYRRVLHDLEVAYVGFIINACAGA